MMGYKIAEVGDIVRIVSVDNCRFGNNSDMKKLVGKTSIVREVVWSQSEYTYVYRLEIDRGAWMWCDRCIEAENDAHEKDIIESEESLDILIGALS